ncbi:MAG: MBL fold metallo-hydrolase [Acidobacteria bacterium]|nr:MBL fold metallo-hydrolase [Acidobacteriota bacterium]
MADDGLSVRIRMYRQGLGDCFLINFNNEAKNQEHNLLIDCGVFQATKSAKEIMTQVAEDIKRSASDVLDAVLMTHEHWDHISGFALAKNVFEKKDFKFNEVWVGWTENRGDPEVDEVKKRFEKKKRGLRAAISRMNTPKFDGIRETVDSLVNEFFGIGADVLGISGSETWEFVLSKTGSQSPKYCSPGEVHTLKGLDGVRIYVLGPPEDIEVLDDEESPVDETYRQQLRLAVTDSFLAAATGSDNDDFDANYYYPFDRKYRIAPTDARSHREFGPFFEENYGFDGSGGPEWKRIDEDWLMMAGDLALNIDGITNNTCLAIAIELVESGKVLLFPGDAQFGNWNSWKRLKWTIQLADGTSKEVLIDDLLKRTVFYKVGHHGSHNATLRKSGLEIMESQDLVAMIPTNREFALSKKTKKTPEGWKMPEQELLERLEAKAKGRVILADEVGGADSKSPLKLRCKNWLDAKETKKFLTRIEFEDPPTLVRNPDASSVPEPLFVDYLIEG